jgi:hypothetical protein
MMGHWVYLNEAGKELYGAIFPDGQIPVVSMIPQWAKLGGSEASSKIYLIRVSDLSSEQFSKIVDSVVKNLNGPRTEIEKDFKEYNIPLREELISGAGTDQMGLFLPDFDEDEYDSDDWEDEDQDDLGEEDEEPW